MMNVIRSLQSDYIPRRLSSSNNILCNKSSTKKTKKE